MTPLKRIVPVLLALAVAANAAIVVLSPQEESFVLAQDFFVSFQVRDHPDVRRVRVYIDNAYVPGELKQSGTAFVYVPDSATIGNGPHVVTIATYRALWSLVEYRHIKFYVIPSESLSLDQRRGMIEQGSSLKGVTPPDLVSDGRVYAGLEYQSVRDSGAWVGRLEAAGNGRLSNGSYHYSLSLNTGESRRYQTLQRFQVGATWRDLVRLNLGDNWPLTNSYLVADQRVRGVEVSANTPRRVANLEVAFGESRQAVAPYPLPNVLVFDGDSVVASDSVDTVDLWNQGVYRRTLVVTRLQFGSGSPFQLGLGLMRATDDKKSLHHPDLLPDSATALDSLRDSLGVFTPRQNLVLSGDAGLALFKERLRVYGAYAFSMFTRDISGGPITQATITDSGRTPSQFSDLPENLGPWFIINETTTPMPFVTDSGSVPATGSGARSMAWNAGVTLTLPLRASREKLDVKYFYVGPNFVTLGNENLAVNRTGYEVNQELLLGRGIVVIRGLFRQSRDLLADIKPAVARRFAYGGSVSALLPGGLPALSVHYQGQNGRRTADSTSFSDVRDLQSSLGVSAHYSAKIARSVTRIGASYTNTFFETSSPGLSDSARAVSISQSGNSILGTLYTAFGSVPFDARLSGGTTLASGDLGLTQLYGSGGIVWHVRKDVLDVSVDASYKYTDDHNFDPVSDLGLQSAANWNIFRTSSLQLRGGLEIPFATWIADRKFLLSYEFRF